MTRRANVQNKQLDKSELERKYGDTKVGVVPVDDLVATAISACRPFSKNAEVVQSAMHAKGIKTTIRTPLRMHVSNHLQYMPRAVAELDESFLQPIVYNVVTARENGRHMYFCTTRIGDYGDPRLKGLMSVGIGGHVDDGETIYSSAERELKEEVGITRSDIFSLSIVGYIHDRSTAVGRVHLGIVRDVWLNHMDISVQEQDKLRGEWVSLDDLILFRNNGWLESWSAIVVTAIENGEM